MVRDLVINLVFGLLARRVVLHYLKNQKAGLGRDDVGYVVALQLKNQRFEIGGELAVLESPQVSALLGGAAVGKALGQFPEVVAILHALEQTVCLLLQRAASSSDFPSVLTKISRTATCSGSDKFALVVFVILLHLRHDPR